MTPVVMWDASFCLSGEEAFGSGWVKISWNWFWVPV
jgi:hypothetical protein